MKIIKNILIIFLVVMVLTSCSGNMNFTIPEDATLLGGFARNLGLFQSFMVYPIGVVINKLTIFTGSAAAAMIITTVVIRSITLPATLKGQMATRQMQSVQPKIQAIEEKYRGRDDAASKQKKQAEMQKVYQEMGISPIGGMLYPFLSLPFFMGVWRATSMVAVIPHSKPLFDIIALGTSPQDAFNNGNYIYLILVALVVITQVVQFRVSNSLTKKRNKSSKYYVHNPKGDALQKQMSIMVYVMAVVMGFMSFTLISAMSIYLIVSALISLAQAYYIDHVMRKADE